MNDNAPLRSDNLRAPRVGMPVATIAAAIDAVPRRRPVLSLFNRVPRD